MFAFFNYWYLQSPGRFLRAFLAAFSHLEGQIGVITTARNLNKPLFQDYTLQGRLIGFGFRLLRILMGIILDILLGTFYLVVFLIWIAFPILCLLSLIGSFIGPAAGGSEIIQSTGGF